MDADALHLLAIRASLQITKYKNMRDRKKLSRVAAFTRPNTA